jgi:hypothetical protein
MRLILYLVMQVCYLCDDGEFELGFKIRQAIFSTLMSYSDHLQPLVQDAYTGE